MPSEKTRTQLKLHVRRGNVLLISVIVLMAMLLGIAVLGTYLSYERGRSGLSLEDKFLARATANSCMEMALQNLGSNASYQGNQNFVLNEVSCNIRPIYKIGSHWIVEVQSQSRIQVYRMRTEVSALQPMTLVSWKEVENF